MDETNLPEAKPSIGLTRRELLNYAWLVSLGILTVNIGGVSLYFSLPQLGKDEFGGIIKIGPVANLPAVNASPLNYPEGKFWLIRTQQGLMSLYNVCPHLDCLLNWNDQDGKFICPCHGSQFNREGVYLSGPAPRSLDRFVLQLVSVTGEVLDETTLQSDGLLPLPTAITTADSLVEVSLLSGNLEITPDTMVQVDTGRRITGGQLPGSNWSGQA